MGLEQARGLSLSWTPATLSELGTERYEYNKTAIEKGNEATYYVEEAAKQD
jgi:hypothetical protein